MRNGYIQKAAKMHHAQNQKEHKNNQFSAIC